MDDLGTHSSRGAAAIPAPSGQRQGIRGWESRNLVIPVRISVLRWQHSDYVGAAALTAQPIIDSSLRDAASDGWRADEPTDFATLFSRAQVRTTDSMFYWRVSSVTVRIVRPQLELAELVLPA